MLVKPTLGGWFRYNMYLDKRDNCENKYTRCRNNWIAPCMLICIVSALIVHNYAKSVVGNLCLCFECLMNVTVPLDICMIVCMIDWESLQVVECWFSLQRISSRDALKTWCERALNWWPLLTVWVGSPLFRSVLIKLFIVLETKHNLLNYLRNFEGK